MTTFIILLAIFGILSLIVGIAFVKEYIIDKEPLEVDGVTYINFDEALETEFAKKRFKKEKEEATDVEYK